ncbi:hypothetical protein B5F07_08735 [Lachnoclostridium sp. An169]|uniref:O-antigen ligase family protein n=1 Tax=Lachnoclostridium sp. An169 TaxID=1965569 RepID=UPI000B374023|nr:O-antigen ligase family protein [Lachnoclostridium sp. An169]OUP84211.1 hypothetical protein B5F07_08735 [Lachnoclostridium sp. An169]
MSKRKNPPKAKNTKITANQVTDPQKKPGPQPLKIFISTAPFLIGLYYEWMSALACIFLLGYLVYCYRITGKIRINVNLLLIAAAVLPVAYGLSAFWAVDSGMALFGMVKYLPLPVFVLAADQVENEERKALLDYVPLSGAVMTVTSGVLSMIPSMNTFFTVNGRLAGFFQYPNTFALYLLVGIIILMTNGKWEKKKIIVLLILAGGIILSGSRTGFVLFAVTVVCFCFLLSDRRIRLRLAGILVLLIAVAGIYVTVTGDTSTVGRFLTTSFSSSTFLGRILYFKDALPVILSHPFGLGYLGYYYTQGAFQTGVYSVVNVHNELLQMLLDVGWIPTVIFVCAFIQGICRGNLQSRMTALVIAVHSMFDFNLQFLSLFFVLLASLQPEKRKVPQKEFNFRGKYVEKSAGIIICCVSLYFGTASGLYYLKAYSAAVSLYPGYTNAWVQLLTQEDAVEGMEGTADRILVMNPNNPLANDAKARAAYSRGNFGSMIEYKHQALEYYRYNLQEYLDYFNMLYVGYQLYLENGDPDSAAVCAQEMKAIPEMLDTVKAQTDPLAYEIADKPQLELPSEYVQILENI